LLYVLLRRIALGVDTFSVSYPVRSVTSNLLTQASVISAYISRSLWPVSLSIEWNWPEMDSILPTGLPWYFSPLVDIPFVLLLALCAALCFRRYPYFTLGAGWFLAALAPESSIIPLVQAANERRLYLPLVGLALLGARFIQLVGARKRFVAWAAAILIVACLSVTTLADAPRWAGSERLWESALKQSPSSLRALHGLAAARLDAGKIESAEVLYDRLLMEYPSYAGGFIGRARILVKKGRYDEAEKYFLQAAQLDLNNDTPWINLVELYSRQGRFAEAESTARKGLGIFTKSPVLWNNLGVALASQGRFEEATQAFDRALQINPNYENAARNRAKAMSDLKNHESVNGSETNK
jgi:tetratricopeptide (TPR) repeat protein